jgi:hypothetical protein
MPGRTLPAFCLCLAACTTAPPTAPRYFYHIGAVGCFDSPADGSIVRVEDRLADGVIRVSNRTRSDIRFYYDVASSFGDYQMFFVRFRDGAGNPIPLPGISDCKFYSPKAYWSDIVTDEERPDRESFIIPAGGYRDIKRDLTDFFAWWRDPKTGTGPCQVQFRLFGYLDAQTREGIGAVTEWQPSPCPGR